MIVYISDSLGSKRNGGVSLSGVDFLQLLRCQYGDVGVVTGDSVFSKAKVNDTFLGKPLSPLRSTWHVVRPYKMRKSVRSFVRYLLLQIERLGASAEVDLGPKCSQNEPNILFVNSWSTLYEAGRVIGDSQYRKICVVRGNPESFLWQSEGPDKQEEVDKAAAYLDKFDELIFVSKVGRDRWKKYLRNDIISHYLPNSIDEEKAQFLCSARPEQLRSSLGLNNSKIHIVTVGSVQIRKGQDMLVDVAKKLLEQGVNNFLIHIVGVISEPWGGREILYKLKSSAFSDHFVFHGHRNDAMALVRAADVCLFTSRAEAFPRTVAEYLALEKPIVSTDVSGVPEMITHDFNGLLCKADDGCEMGTLVKKILDNNDLSEFLSANARRTYETEFSKACQFVRAVEIFSKIQSHLKS